MTKKPLSIQDIPMRTRVLFAMRRLSKPLQSELLSDSAFVARWEIGVQQPLALAPGFSVDRTTLFAAFQNAADGKDARVLKDEKGVPINADVTIESDGAAVVKTKTRSIRFSHASLLTADPTKRSGSFAQMQADLCLRQSDRNELRALVRRNNFSESDFMRIAEVLSASPDEFAGELKESFKRRAVSAADILPNSPEYWEHLTAPLGTSTTLGDFISNELAQERQSRVSLDAIVAVRSIALTFASPGLVPLDLWDSLPIDSCIQVLIAALELDDHFSLVAAFELCARWVKDDPRLAELGDALLERLLGDKERLVTSCAIFAAAFVLTAAFLAQDSHTKTKPAFWRHLCAAAHASLVVRACGVSAINREELLAWAMNQSGTAYFLSMLLDAATEPRWSPEWIDPQFIAADVCGRAIAAVLNHQDQAAVPQSWKDRAEEAAQWLDREKIRFASFLPAIMEGARVRQPSISELELIKLPLQAFLDEPTPKNLLKLNSAISTFGFPHEGREHLFMVLAVVRREAIKLNDETTQDTLKLIGHVAVLYQDVALADAVAEISIERLPLQRERRSVLETIYRIIEGASANPDLAASRQTLVRRLENIAFLVQDGDLLADVFEHYEILKRIDPALETRLGKAIAIARLGASPAKISA